MFRYKKKDTNAKIEISQKVLTFSILFIKDKYSKIKKMNKKCENNAIYRNTYPEKLSKDSNLHKNRDF